MIVLGGLLGDPGHVARQVEVQGYCSQDEWQAAPPEVPLRSVALYPHSRRLQRASMHKVLIRLPLAPSKKKASTPLTSHIDSVIYLTILLIVFISYFETPNMLDRFSM